MIFQRLITHLKQLLNINRQPFFYPCGCSLAKRTFCCHDAPKIIAEDTKEKKKRPRKRTSSKKSKDEIKQELLNSDIDTNDITNLSLLSKKRNISSLHLLSKEGAKKFASVVAQDLIKNNAPVLEIQAGPGFLTEELLKAGVPRITMFERIPAFFKYSKHLLENYPDRVRLKERNLLNIAQLAYYDVKHSHHTIEDIFEGIEFKNYGDEYSMQFVGALPNVSMLRHFSIPSYGNLKTPFNHGRLIFYVAVPPSMSYAFADTPDSILHSRKNIYLRIFYDYKLLDQVSRDYFFPLSLPFNYKNKNMLYYENDDKVIDIVKIEMKANVFNENFTPNQCEYLYSFLTICIRRHDTRIIPVLEKWFPDCGPSVIIKHNINIYTRFKELKAQELFNLYQFCRSLPEYQSSPFISFVENA